MSQYNSQNPLVMDRELKVQEVSVPFIITGNASAASVSISCDEPGFVFFRTAGVDQITPALGSGEVATYSVSPVDSSGTFNIFLTVNQLPGEYVTKIVSASVTDRVNGGGLPCKLGSSTGLSTNPSALPAAQNDIMLTCVSSVNFTTSAVLNASLTVKFIVLDY